MQMSRLRWILGTVAAGALLVLPALADSQARIVRLSDVQGTVQIDKNSGLGFENAFANLPIMQGAQLRARDNGRAEVEFEDGSMLRVAPNTTVVFDTLGLNDAGGRISVVELIQGRAYVNWLGKNGDAFTLSFSQEKVKLTQAAHFRVAVSSSRAEVASFKNEVEVTGPSGAVKVDKKKMVAFDLNDNDKSTLAKNFEADPFDEWDQQANEYHEQYSKNNSTPYGYGFSDLSYYGAYSNVPGYGTLWQPYFAGAGWNPFMDGAWSWYPGMGYLWASAYPWGWMPYYYGNWAFAPGFGWGWQPSGWSTWHGGLHYVGAVAGFRAPVAPVGTFSTVAVGRGGVVGNSAPVERTVIRSGSAGLGVPRGSYENLRHLNTQVAKTGSVEMRSAPAFAASSWHGVGLGLGAEHSAQFGEAEHSGARSGGHVSGGAGHSGH
jgi:FecR protein